VRVLDFLAEIYSASHKDSVEIVVTCIYRPDDLDSYHSKWQAIDLRTRDWPVAYRIAIQVILVDIKRFDPRIQHEFESDHLHIEFDDGSLTPTDGG
jgi:hypothetical protein